MSWLNWSLKFHIRLRTVSILIPTHITHVYVQWMPYSFVWLYLFKCVSHTKFLLIKHKFFFEFLIVFGKSFVFAKISKISKIVLPCSGDLITGQSSCMSSVTSLLRWFSGLTGRSVSQSWKILRNFFKILGF